jgi:hypothetical protein
LYHQRYDRTEDPIDAHKLCPCCEIIPQSPNAFRHSTASIMSLFQKLRIEVTSFLVLLNTLSHSVDVCGYRKSVSDLICPFTSFRFISGRRNDNLLLSIFLGLSFTVSGNPEQPGSYHWSYYVLLIISGGPGYC